MSETVNKGWLEDVEGNKFAPKTLMEQVLSPDGVNLINFLNAILGVIDISGIGDGTIKGAIDALNTLVNGKQPSITGGASSITSDNLTANNALISDSNGKVAVSGVSATELGYLSGATSNIQTQIDNKVEGSEYGRTIANLATKAELEDGLSTKSYTTHTHDERYYLKASIDIMMNSVGADISSREFPIGTCILSTTNDSSWKPQSYGNWRTSRTLTIGEGTYYVWERYS